MTGGLEIMTTRGGQNQVTGEIRDRSSPSLAKVKGGLTQSFVEVGSNAWLNPPKAFGGLLGSPPILAVANYCEIRDVLAEGFLIAQRLAWRDFLLLAQPGRSWTDWPGYPADLGEAVRR